tara:strand:- start:4454 stop:6514 length:2061 start_codon:yes stop_codon:yes gene_type:complete
MPNQIVDSENVVLSLETAPDKLRAEIGNYYFLDNLSQLRPENWSSTKIKTAQIVHSPDNNQVLIPIKKSTITIQGDDRAFRDYTQWNQFISGTITLNRQFLDHTFGFQFPSVESEFIKNFHNAKYEDSSKEFPSNHLLNYNLIAYPHIQKSESIKNAALIRNKFDMVDPTVEKLLDQYSRRIVNYTGSLVSLTDDNTNIFILSSLEDSDISIEDFPYYYRKTFGRNPRQSRLIKNFRRSIMNHKKEKNIFKMLKNNSFFSNRSFNVDGGEIIGKIHNLTSFLTSTAMSTFAKNYNETFLLQESEIDHSNISERFVNQIESINFLSEMRSIIASESRNISDIFNVENCESFLLGYKIEKYINNDATLPIQTYYVTSDSLYDTQIKYGREYIYKTKAFVGILGSSYGYSNLLVAKEDNTADNPTGQKYWAQVDVNVTPSFQILEIEIDVNRTIFEDTPMSPPEVTYYGNKLEPTIRFLFQPKFVNYMNQLQDYETSINYFKGAYEIYRLESPPQSKDDFDNASLGIVNKSIKLGNFEKGFPIKTYNVFYATYLDTLVPNKKYYYAFKSVTHHETRSELTSPIEVEVQKDSDEHKIVVRGYTYPEEKMYSRKKRSKRLISIVPNIDRLLFTTPLGVAIDKNNWELSNNELVAKPQGTERTFKIRVTSKHTGKKIDLNLTFKLNLDDTFK